MVCCHFHRWSVCMAEDCGGLLILRHLVTWEGLPRTFKGLVNSPRHTGRESLVGVYAGCCTQETHEPSSSKLGFTAPARYKKHSSHPRAMPSCNCSPQELFQEVNAGPANLRHKRGEPLARLGIARRPSSFAATKPCNLQPTALPAGSQRPGAFRLALASGQAACKKKSSGLYSQPEDQRRPRSAMYRLQDVFYS